MTLLILKADLPAYGGFCISRHEGKIVMIEGNVIPGETVEAVIKKEKKDYIEASVTRVIEPSPFRIEPACKYFGSCGGCHIQYVSYKKQVQLKEEILKDCLKRLAKIETALEEALVDKNPWHYRIRGQFKVSHDKIGFYRSKTREVIDIDKCPLMTEGINTDLQKVRQLLKGMDVEEIHISRGDCSIALIMLSRQTVSRVVYDNLASSFMDSGFPGLYVQSKDGKSAQYGKRFITLSLGNLKYTISAMSFLQSHWKLNQAVAAFIKEKLTFLKGKKMLDLYAGAGNFSLLLADSNEITAVEENKYAVEDGIRNVEINNLKNYRFIHSSAEDFYIDEKFDIVILDPPRPGLSQQVVDEMLRLMPEKIVYISCNPSTLARDLRKLSGHYDIESVRLIDFFPQTFHIESLAILNRRSI